MGSSKWLAGIVACLALTLLAAWTAAIMSLEPHDRQELLAGRPDAALEAWSNYRSARELFKTLFSSPFPVEERERSFNLTEPTVGVSDIVPTRPNAPKSWGIDRINQHSLPLDNEYSPTFEGVGIHVFVLDTGVMPSHAEFEDRLGVGANCIGGGGCKVDEPTTDRQGHGTHVACTVGSDDFGVADRVTIHPVKVLNDNGSGSVMNVVNGMRWVATLVENNKGSLRGKSVVVMSLGTQRDEFLNEAADALVDSGVPVVVAAGNNSEDACDFSPASATKVISVGATDSHDRLPDFTNFGSCVTILAPGTAINSCDIAHMTASVTKSGTSMAAPHVAGVVAQLLERAALKDEMLTPEQVKEQLLDMATHGAANIGSNQRGTASIMLAVPGTVPVDTSAGMATVLLIVAICCGVCTLVVRKTGQEQRWGVQGMFDMA